MVDLLVRTGTTFLDRLLVENELRPDWNLHQLLSAIGRDPGTPTRDVLFNTARREHVDRTVDWLIQTGRSTRVGAFVMARGLAEDLPAWDLADNEFGISLITGWESPAGFSLAVAAVARDYLQSAIAAQYPQASITIDDAIDGSQHFRGRARGIIDAGIGGVVTAALLALGSGAAHLAFGNGDAVRDQCAEAMKNGNVQSVHFAAGDGCVVRIGKSDLVPADAEEVAVRAKAEDEDRIIDVYGWAFQVNGQYTFKEAGTDNLIMLDNTSPPPILDDVMHFRLLLRDQRRKALTISVQPVEWPIRTDDLIRRA